MSRTVSEKLGIKAGMRTLFVSAPADALQTIDTSGLKVAASLRGDFDYIHLFANSQAVLDRRFPKLRDHLKPTGVLWISWPKAGQMGTDLILTKIIKTGYDHGLVESKTLSVNATWSAIKFTHPIKGKTYRNSYGKLRER